MIKKNPTPWTIERIEPKGRSGLHLNIVDANGEYVLGGFGYFQEETLQRICDGVNTTESTDAGKMQRTIRSMKKAR